MKQRALSNLEQQVMNIVWAHENVSVRDVLGELLKKRIIAYSTVATILLRLENKGLVRKDTHTMTFLYSPSISKEKYSKGIASSFIKKFVQSFGNTAISSFAESMDELSGEKKAYFMRLLEQHDKHK